LTSQYLAGSSLSDDALAADVALGASPNDDAEGKAAAATEAKQMSVPEQRGLVPAPQQHMPVYYLEEDDLELDELNQHECMPSLLQLMERLHTSFDSAAANEGEDAKASAVSTQASAREAAVGMPSWMKNIHASFTQPDTPHNARLFLTKLITNMPHVFRPHAAAWLRPLMQVILRFHADPQAAGDSHSLTHRSSRGASVADDGAAAPGFAVSTGFNYLVTDICVQFIQWADVAIPQERDEVKLAQQVVAHLMHNAYHDTPAVFKNNMNIIKLLMERWGAPVRTSVPFGVIYGGLSGTDPEARVNLAGLHLLSVAVANDVVPTDAAFEHEDANVTLAALFDAVVRNLNFKSRAVYRAAASVIGMLLQVYQQEQMPAELTALAKRAAHAVALMARNDAVGGRERFISALHAICNVETGFPPLADEFVARLLFLLPSLAPDFRTMALEILMWRAPDIDNIFVELRGKNLRGLIRHQQKATQAVVLSILIAVLHKLSRDEIAFVMDDLILSCARHPEATVRRLFHDFLMGLYDLHLENGPSGDPATSAGRQLHDRAREQLLLALSDESAELRGRVVAFFDHGARLSQDHTYERLAASLEQLYAPAAEENFLKVTTALLLQLTQRSPDYGRLLYEQPLSECAWTPYHVAHGWQQRNQHLTPLFNATLLGPGAAGTLAGGTMGSQSQAAGGAPWRALRATQAGGGGGDGGEAFTPTADLSSSFDPGTIATAHATQTQYSTTADALMFRRRRRRMQEQGIGASQGAISSSGATQSSQLASQQREAREIAHLKRRFVRGKQSATTAGFHARRAERRKHVQRRALEMRRQARHAQVQLHRAYRDGDLPDVQIKHSDLLKPLQAAAQRDDILAQLIFQSLFQAIDEQLPTLLDSECAAAATRQRCLQQASTNMTRSQVGHTPFVAGMHTVLTLAQPDDLLLVHLKPSEVSMASRISRSLHTGALLLERRLEVQQAHLEPPPAKRRRGVTSDALASASDADCSPEELSHWVHLGRIYRSLEEHDMLLSIFRPGVGEPVTAQALTLEQEGKFTQAGRLYHQSMQSLDQLEVDDPKQEEVDFWETSIFDCFKHLCRWDLLQSYIDDVLADDRQAGEGGDGAGGIVNRASIWDPGYSTLLIHLDNLMVMQVQVACLSQCHSLLSQPGPGGAPSAGETSFHATRAFLEDARAFPERWGVLRRRFPLELATVALLEKDYDRARALAQEALERFLDSWSSLGPLQAASRRATLRNAQPLVEMLELIDFVQNEDSFVGEAPLDALLTTWRARTPRPLLDPLYTWDIVAVRRRVYFNHIVDAFEARFRSGLLLGSGDDADESLMDVDEEEALLREADALGQDGGGGPGSMDGGASSSVSATGTLANVQQRLLLEEARTCLMLGEQATRQGPPGAATQFMREARIVEHVEELAPATRDQLHVAYTLACVPALIQTAELSLGDADPMDPLFKGLTHLRDVQPGGRLEGALALVPTQPSLARRLTGENLLALALFMARGPSNGAQEPSPFTAEQVELLAAYVPGLETTLLGAESVSAQANSAVNALAGRGYSMLKGLTRADDPRAEAALPVGWQIQESKSRAGQIAYASDPCRQRLRTRPTGPPNNPLSKGRDASPLPLHFPSAISYEPTEVEGFVKLAQFCEDVLAALRRSAPAVQAAEADGSGGVVDVNALGAQLADIPRAVAEAVAPVEELRQVMVESVLTAMRCGSQQAQQMFPTLLQVVGGNAHLQNVLATCAFSVPSWLFLPWVPQMLAVLDKPEAAAVFSVLSGIGRAFPQALIFPVLISAEKVASGTAADERYLRKLSDLLLLAVPGVPRLVQELRRLHNPDLYFKDWINNMKQLVQAGDRDNIKREWEDLVVMLAPAFGRGARGAEAVGPLWQSFAKHFGSKIRETLGQDSDKLQHRDAARALRKIQAEIPAMVKWTTQRWAQTLKEYSPYLSAYQGSDEPTPIEVPGQYSGRRKPQPEEHALITGFDDRIRIMSSIRKPKQVTIRGSDERDYPFLVKGGEDIRMDQRMEQLFGVMNDVLTQDPRCNPRGLRLRTYAVVPMTTRVGIIEWVGNTAVLKEFIKDAMSPKEASLAKKRPSPHDHYHAFLGKYCPASTNVAQYYVAVLSKANYTDTVRSFHEREALLPATLLRTALQTVSASPEAYLTTRQHFGRSIATLSICHYLLGIGDRHLSNCMIDRGSGGVIGIDFGHNFGSATQTLPVPELMPFRLTRQITSVFLPHRDGGMLKHVMVLVLAALRANHRLLLSTMDVFVNEPSLDWEQEAQKMAEDMLAVDIGSESLAASSSAGLGSVASAVSGTSAGSSTSDSSRRSKSARLALLKLRLAQNKLQGHNPAYITQQELARNAQMQKDPKLLRSVQALAAGDKSRNIRARLASEGLTVTEQVECLLDQATDPNILGRTFSGWEPWV
jgi:DNA-dependent protein kinase catalytic subunit